MFADTDNDGVVSAKELKQVMALMGNELTDQEVRDIIKESGSTDSINYSKFCSLLGIGIKQSRTKESDPEAEMRHAFSLFDRDRDGVISPKDMRAALAGFGVTLTEREVDQVSRARAHANVPPPRAALSRRPPLTTCSLRGQLIGEATLSAERKVSYDVFKRVMGSNRTS